jgi:hypothetical protein
MLLFCGLLMALSVRKTMQTMYIIQWYDDR